MVFAIALYLRGRWTWAFATVNAILAAAFAIPAVYLLMQGLLFNDELVASIEAQVNGDWFTTTVGITAVVIILITAIDAIDGFRKAWRTSRQEPAPA